MTVDAKRVVTGIVRLSYVHVTKPRANPNNPGEEPKYSVTLLIPKNDAATMQRNAAAIEAAKQEAIAGLWKGVVPPNLAVPIHDGDGVKQNGEPFGAECKGHWVITASSKVKPGLIDENKNPIIDDLKIYSGCYAYVSLRFFGYFSNGKKGIGAGLGNIMKARDGEPLGGFVSAEDDFGHIQSVSYAPASGGTFNPGQYAAPVVSAVPQAVPYAAYTAPAMQPAQPVAVDPITGLPIGGILGVK